MNSHRVNAGWILTVTLSIVASALLGACVASV